MNISISVSAIDEVLTNITVKS
uniref:Uncharacterized protein n=1 Tax=Anguilla anguilla TaxID=7936 RepID=A0A0E9PMJ4_ANGAN